MSEPDTPKKQGGLKQPSREVADPALSKIGGGETREPGDADDVEREDSPGGREGGMIGEG